MGHYLRKHRYMFIVGALAIIGLFLLHKKSDLDQTNMANLEMGPLETNAPEMDELSEEDETFIVDIKGAVKSPGVYSISADTRLVDVITLANGFTKKADEKRVNLAQRVSDEMLIYIPEIGEEDFAVTGLGGTKMDNENAGKVRINQATAAELETLNGIGPSKAQAILDHIEENGPLNVADDLLHINGIGEKTLEKFKDDIIIP